MFLLKTSQEIISSKNHTKNMVLHFEIERRAGSATQQILGSAEKSVDHSFHICTGKPGLSLLTLSRVLTDESHMMGLLIFEVQVSSLSHMACILGNLCFLRCPSLCAATCLRVLISPPQCLPPALQIDLGLLSERGTS